MNKKQPIFLLNSWRYFTLIFFLPWLFLGLHAQTANTVLKKDMYFGYCFDLPYANLQLDEPNYPLASLPIYHGHLPTIKLTELRPRISEDFRDLSVTSSLCTAAGRNKPGTIESIAKFYGQKINMPTKPIIAYCFKKKQFLEVIYDMTLSGRPAYLRVQARFDCKKNAVFEAIPRYGYVEKAKLILYEFSFDSKSSAEAIKKQINGK